MRKESFGSVTTFWLDRDEAIRRVSAAARHLVRARQDVQAVLLFGSLAQGRAVPGSDADVLILLTASGTRWLDRPLEFGSYFDDCGIGVDLFCYTLEEVAETPLARNARAGGILLAGRP